MCAVQSPWELLDVVRRKFDTHTVRNLPIFNWRIAKFLTSSRKRFTISPFLPMMLPTSCNNKKKGLLSLMYANWNPMTLTTTNDQRKRIWWGARIRPNFHYVDLIIILFNLVFIFVHFLLPNFQKQRCQNSKDLAITLSVAKGHVSEALNSLEKLQ